MWKNRKALLPITMTTRQKNSEKRVDAIERKACQSSEGQKRVKIVAHRVVDSIEALRLLAWATQRHNFWIPWRDGTTIKSFLLVCFHDSQIKALLPLFLSGFPPRAVILYDGLK